MFRGDSIWRQRGLGMIELMIALVITLILGIAVGGVFLVSSRGFSDAEDFARIQDNGRYAMHNLVQDLRMAGFWGDVFSPSIFKDPDLDAVTVDCSGEAAALDFTYALFAKRLGASDTGAFTCITDAAPDSDVLVVKHATGAPVAATALSPDRFYVMTNWATGFLFSGDDSTPPTTIEDGDVEHGRAWALEVHVYYVRNDSGDRRLYRKTLRKIGTEWMMVSEEVAAGVDAIRFLFGIDTNSDAEVDTYVNASSISGAGAWEKVLTVQVFLLVRGGEDRGYTDARTYDMGDVEVTFNDSYHRSLMTTSVNLRNPVFALRGGFSQ